MHRLFITFTAVAAHRAPPLMYTKPAGTVAGRAVEGAVPACAPVPARIGTIASRGFAFASTIGGAIIISITIKRQTTFVCFMATSYGIS
jgi:hypothetical protein